MRKTTGFITNDNNTDNMAINRPLLVKPIHNNHRGLIAGIVILTHTLSFLLGFYVNDIWIKGDCSIDGSL